MSKLENNQQEEVMVRILDPRKVDYFDLNFGKAMDTLFKELRNTSETQFEESTLYPAFLENIYHRTKDERVKATIIEYNKIMRERINRSLPATLDRAGTTEGPISFWKNLAIKTKIIPEKQKVVSSFKRIPSKRILDTIDDLNNSIHKQNVITDTNTNQDTNTETDLDRTDNFENVTLDQGPEKLAQSDVNKEDENAAHTSEEPNKKKSKWADIGTRHSERDRNVRFETYNEQDIKGQVFGNKK